MGHYSSHSKTNDGALFLPTDTNDGVHYHTIPMRGTITSTLIPTMGYYYFHTDTTITSTLTPMMGTITSTLIPMMQHYSSH
ncbi:unnamed protein product [Staurois parvus]|uniref:Uncharacterized protein n=1 Tax=Staurois parvus TaxID=386267 RepID=A0ABN9D6Z5_9NEOB|nr:unnamed protein product [Staurois parvus]